MRRVLVTGASGFIGHHLVRRLVDEGFEVRGVDVRESEFAPSAAHETLLGDLRSPHVAAEAVRGVDAVYALAADMGGMGYITANGASILHNNLLIDANTIEAAARAGVQRVFYASSACVYPSHLQTRSDPTGLREEDAFPAQPDDAYGWEKLIGEKLCLEYALAGRLECRIARFHNIFGPLGTWQGGREKAPAAMCRKIAVARLTGSDEIEIWGDGAQTRSFCCIDDCIEGVRRLMDSDWATPVNIGQERLISIDALADLVAGIAGVRVRTRHVPGPQGVRGRNADCSLARRVIGWEPRVTLEEGLARTYAWIEGCVRASLEGEASEREWGASS